MNEKFFQLPLEKQERIIKAGYKVFANNSYKQAPMSEIAIEGDISKGLLFYYFKNKKELYFFLWDKAIERLRLAAKEQGVWDTNDFFEVIHRGIKAKCYVIRNFPCLYQFAIKAYYEQDAEISLEIKEKYYEENFNLDKLEALDVSNIRHDINVKLLYQEILLVADGYLRQMILYGKLDADQIEKDFTTMLEQWKKVYSI